MFVSISWVGKLSGCHLCVVYLHKQNLAFIYMLFWARVRRMQNKYIWSSITIHNAAKLTREGSILRANIHKYKHMLT